MRNNNVLENFIFEQCRKFLLGQSMPLKQDHLFQLLERISQRSTYQPLRQCQVGESSQKLHKGCRLAKNLLNPWIVLFTSFMVIIYVFKSLLLQYYVTLQY